MSELNEGIPLRVVAEQLDLPTVPYSEKSLWRWKKEWDRLLKILEPVFWQTVLSSVPHLHLPRGSRSPRSNWGTHEDRVAAFRYGLIAPIVC